MPGSVASSASGGSGASSYVDSIADLPGAGKNQAEDRYKYIYYVGGKDLYEATQALAYGITRDTIAAYDEMKTLNVALLVLTIVLPVVYLLFIFRPMLALVRQHTSKVAGLLLQLPPEVDVESKLKAALDHSKRNTSQQQQQDGEDDLDE